MSRQTVSEAVVLCGGLGTRLRSHDAERPKALVPVAGRPFLAWQLEWLRGLGVRRVVLATGYRSEQVAEWISSHAAELQVDVEVVVESGSLGTAGALRNALRRVRDEMMFVTNGDTLLPQLSLEGPLSGDDRESVLVAVEVDGQRSGDRLELMGDRVVGLERSSAGPGSWVNGGFYRLPRRLIAQWPEGVRSLERQVFPGLASTGALVVHRSPPPLLDMGTPEGLRQMAEHLLRRKVPSSAGAGSVAPSSGL